MVGIAGAGEWMIHSLSTFSESDATCQTAFMALVTLCDHPSNKNRASSFDACRVCNYFKLIIFLFIFILCINQSYVAILKKPSSSPNTVKYGCMLIATIASVESVAAILGGEKACEILIAAVTR